MHVKDSIAALLLGLFLIGATSAGAQNNTNSPYTRFGYGELANSTTGQLRSMGGAATAMRSNRYINPLNPASYAAVDSMTFMFDIGVSGMYSHFKTSAGSVGKLNANLEYVTLQFPLWKHTGMSAGLLPYSYVGYNFGHSDSAYITVEPHQAEQKLYYSHQYVGNGGLTQAYIGVAGEIARHVSLGVNAYYLWGDINHQRTLTFTSTDYYSQNILSTLHVSDFRVRLGLQAYHTFAHKHYLALGLAWEPQTRLKSEFFAVESVSGDTLTSLNSDKRFDLPSYFSAGLTYSFDRRLTASADLTLHGWSKAHYEGVSDTLQNITRLNFGLSFQNNAMSRKYADRIIWRIGGNYSSSYFREASGNNFGITFGLGLPMRGNNSQVNATFEYNHHGAQSAAGLKEDIFKLSLNATFSETWFFKRKI